uniref:Uncharacterized protein n=1 Tax=Quercus lobata TaxID=97700 RepID=A0A7N2L1G5_QUELO
MASTVTIMELVDQPDLAPARDRGQRGRHQREGAASAPCWHRARAASAPCWSRIGAVSEKYQEAFQTKQEQETEAIQQQQPHIVPSNQEWQIILKVAAHKNRRSKTLDGNELFSGGASCGRKNQQLAIQDAVGEAILKAMQMGYNKILILSNNNRLVQLCNQGKDPT